MFVFNNVKAMCGPIMSAVTMHTSKDQAHLNKESAWKIHKDV